MPRRLLIVRHSGLRPVTEAEVLESLPRRLPGGQPVVHHVDTQQFASDVERGHWGGQPEALAGAARKILADAGGTEIHYFGLDEIPHIITLGALIGDEHAVAIHDWDRDAGSWRWPSRARTLNLATSGLPVGDPVPARGSAVLRVEISFAIAGEDVRAAAGPDHLAVVRIGHAKGTEPAICKVRSALDLIAIRTKIRRALSVLRRCLPGLTLLHVFVAAPVSVCFALGQELKPRNSPPIQTYRYRRLDGQPSYKPAILLSLDRHRATAREWPDPIGTADLANRLKMDDANYMAKQLRAALDGANQAVKPSQRGVPYGWTHAQLRTAAHHLRAGKLRSRLEASGLIEPE